MHVDHINENTIRVRIDKNELANRGLKVLDLLGDKSKIQHFFYSILDEVDTDHSFSQDAPVTFQVMPNKGGLDLLISKVTDKDRNNLAQFLNDDGETAEAEDDLDSRRSFIDLDADNEVQAQPAPTTIPAETATPKKDKSFWKFQKKQAYSFDDLDALTELADNLRVSDLGSSLYFERGKFFLELTFANEDYAEIKPADAWAIANEYGLKVKSEEMARVRTTGKCLIASDALGQLRHYFGHAKR